MEKPGQDHYDTKFDNGVFSGERETMNEDHIPRLENRYEYRKNRQTDKCAYCEQCMQNSKKNNNTPLVIVALASITVLLIAFLATLFCLIHVVVKVEKIEQYTSGVSVPPYENAPHQSEIPGTDNNGAKPEMMIPQKPETDNSVSGEYYGDITDAIRTDLKYSVDFKNYTYEGNNDYIMIAVDYPVIKGDVPNMDVLNEVIANEIEYFEEYYKEYSQYMLEGEAFAVYSEGAVTYMDEEKMSIVYTETVYTDYWQDTGLFCINIDMENGVVLDNSSIIDINNEFAVDFRIRSREQNGTVNALDYMTDQEIMYYLSGTGTAIVFYTPLGMEVGLNYGESYVTVTYKDYEQFLQKY